MAKARKLRNVTAPRQQDEVARLKVIQGPDYGSIFVLTSARATIGRGDECDVVISDLKASRLHAELQTTADGWSVRDMGSANGILHNLKPAASGTLKSGDSITIGETLLEFVAGDSRTAVFTAPPRSVAEVQSKQAALAARQDALRGHSKDSGRSAKPVLIAVALIVVYGLMSTESESPKKESAAGKRAGKQGETRDLASFLPQFEQTGESNPRAETFFREGLRELREKNYLRAKANFDLTLQISPEHPKAGVYKSTCEKEIDAEATAFLERGRRSLDSGKERLARGNFEAVLRRLFTNQSDARYIEATDMLKKMDEAKKSGGGG